MKDGKVECETCGEQTTVKGSKRLPWPLGFQCKECTEIARRIESEFYAV